MRRELRLLFTALSFYTRLPVPGDVHQNNAAQLPDAIRYLPVVGWIVGGMSALVYVAADYLLDSAIAIVLSVVTSIFITGAFHEDGFADVCDGFGGGWTKDRILEIMKDSRLGTFGVCGLLLIVSLKFLSLQYLLSDLLKGLNVGLVFSLFVVAHTLSRFAAITVVFNHEYARIEESKASGAVEKGKSVNLVVAGIYTVIPLTALVFVSSKPMLFLLFVPVLLVALLAGRYFKKWIGGYTGDCLGAVQQLSEVVIYLSYILLWKFI